MADKILLRADSAADWTSNDPTLGQGEIGIETDTNKIKIGDGSTAWTSLSYPYYLASEVDTISGTMDDHNEMHNIQGGATNDYYHLTLAQHTDLTDSGDCSSHNHDGMYYTETEIDTISGSLSDEIDSDIATLSGILSNEIDSDISTHEAGSSHDSRYYTESEVDALTWTESDVTDLDKYTMAEVDTISGTLSDALDTHKSSTDHDGRYYTESEVDALTWTESDIVDLDKYTASEVDALIAAVTASGISGWFDDGTNFRVTFVNGIITDVDTTVSGGYNVV